MSSMKSQAQLKFDPKLNIPRLKFLFLSVLALVGLTLSILLTHHFYEIRGEGVHFKSACNLGTAVNCDLVAASPSAELFSGFPLSSFAAGWFLTFFFISLFNYQKQWQREAARATLGLTLIGVCISGFYFWLMRVKLQTLCLYCLGVDLSLLASFVIALSLKPELSLRSALNRSQWKNFLMIGVGSHIAMIFGLSALDQNAFRPTEAQEVAESILSSPPVHIDLDDHSPSIGPKNAPITIVEFSDFQCPFCRIGALNLNTLLYRYPGKIRVVFKNYPLDQKCNADFPQTMHPAACEAARNAICAHEQGQFEGAYEILFEKQSSLLEGKVAGLLSGLSLDQARLSACAAAPATSLQIMKDLAEGKTLGITGTPTFFVNGHRIDGIRPNLVWNGVVDRLMQP